MRSDQPLARQSSAAEPSARTGWSRRSLLAATAAGLAMTLADAGPAAAATTARRTQATAAARAAAKARTARAAASRRVLSGAYVPDPYWDPQGWPNALAAYSARIGAAPQLVHWFAAWGGEQPFPAGTAAQVRSLGLTPLVTWEPWDWTAGADQPAYRLDRIAGGAFDGYVRRWAEAATAFGSPVYLRFAPEMNGDWNPWSTKVNDNGKGDFIRAWRRVRRIFESVGASNVRWVWTPIVNHWGSTPLAQVFPGSRWVDVVGLDGYNWGTTKSYTSWQSFSQVFGPSLADVRRLSTKPLWIAEVGSTDQGGDKAAWVADMFAQVRNDSRIDALVWFDANKETDWRVNSSPAVLKAFQRGYTSAPFG